MSIHILCHDSCKETAARIGNAIEQKTGKRVIVTMDAEDLDRTTGPFIRYGNTSYVNRKDTEYNTPEVINMCADKGLFSEVMSSNGIHTPIFYSMEDTPLCREWIVVRTTLCSYGGRGIHIAKSLAGFKKLRSKYPDAVWTPFIKTEFELRVHVLGGKVKKIFRKVFDGCGNEADYPIRNQQHYSYYQEDLNDYKSVQKTVNQIQKELKGQAYSLDMGWDAATNQYFVFEANSGSGLNSHTAGMYADFFIKSLKIN